MSGEVDTGNFDGLADLAPAVDAALDEWQAADGTRRLWDRDASLWTGSDEAEWLGWLDIVEDQLRHMEPLQSVAEAARVEGFTHMLLLGMGGSSLCPEVLKMTFGKREGFPELFVLDSTDPAQVRSLERAVDIERTLFIVSSKSGTTLEPNIFLEYFFEQVQQRLGADQAGSRFVAITDPSSRLQRIAERENFRYVFHGIPSIGGRYSALSDFGMVPAAAMGLDVERLLLGGRAMAQVCGAAGPADENPGVRLGVTLGVAAARGRNKVTLVTSPGILDLGAWLEQLLAESTGKQGVALIPVDREELGGSGAYGEDRLFVYLRLYGEADHDQDEAISWLAETGHPVVQIEVSDRYSIAGEFFRWEFATAVAGSLLGINPFNQPDVEASKVATRALTDAYEKGGALPAELPILEDSGLKLFADRRNAEELAAAAGASSAAAYLKAHLGRLEAGDYFAILAYLEMTDGHEARLQAIRHGVRDERRVATCLGFGPRFLHSTGQAYKGGPNSGVFLQVTCDDPVDLPVPGHAYSFGVVKAAQARGDFDVLADRGRRALRVHLGADVEAGLDTLRRLVSEVLA
ncbi:MAG TPA: bifunctional transaldolase/phosoglucose isomerase [Gemmatimonadota bacterium]|nr:bifunctional transaldolase/phosoglucose isomerase [Gemmatimonadota bacterium]